MKTRKPFGITLAIDQTLPETKPGKAAKSLSAIESTPVGQIANFVQIEWIAGCIGNRDGLNVAIRWLD